MESKNYLVTGASRGIGYDTAIALAASAQHQVFVLSRNEKRLQYLAERAEELYGHQNIEIMAADLASINTDEIARWIGPSKQLAGVINNAGLLINKPFLELSEEDWQLSFQVNFFAVVRLLKSLRPMLNRGSHILNIGSMGGYQGSSKFPGLGAYSASKAALSNLTEYLAEEWKEDGIISNCLALGAVQTDMLETAFPGFQAPVTSTQMGEMVAWFAQNGQQFFNGKVLPVSVSTP
ncbi:MAG: SDR family oxidoreductase [Bacteroidota bacterium]